MPEIAFVNGRFMPLKDAMVPVEDRGFQFGDGVYEVIRTYGGALFQLDAHLARLERSAMAIALANPFSLKEWQGHIEAGIHRAGFAESKVYLQLTRGVAPRDHQYPEGTAPTAVITIREMRSMDPTGRAIGIEAITLEDVRWGRCDIKSVNLLANIMARQRAKEAGAFEAIFVRQGMVTEGAVSNVMVIRKGVLITPPEGPAILSGVTRRLVLHLANMEGLVVREQEIDVSAFFAVDEMFLTGTTVEVLPMVRVDRRPIGTGRPGELSRLLSARFDELVRGELMSGQEPLHRAD